MSSAALQWSLDALLDTWVESDVPELNVTGVNLDSRLVVSGDVYMAVAGSATHGIHYAVSAVDAGAVAVLVNDTSDENFAGVFEALATRNVPTIQVPHLDTHCAGIASRFYGEPDKAMTIVAVTGTDGKTSVCRFIAQALNAGTHTCGYIGTLGWGVDDDLEDTALTTPDRVALRRMLAVMRNKGAQIVALEASSHGIAEGRLDGLSLDIAVLTNLGRDHLDYHGTVEAYRAAKERLFHWDTLHSIVLNVDDAMGRDLAAQPGALKCHTYSAKGAPSQANSSHVLASRIATSNTGLSFNLISSDVERVQTVSTTLLGRFNVDNLLASYCCLRACGIAANDAVHAISRVTPVVGRMELLGGGQLPTVVVDYSHTPNALTTAIDSVRAHCDGKLWVIFGCGGDRDAGKRAPMARAAQVAEHVVLTDDNPRTESSASIISQVMEGFDRPDEITVIADRAAAIHHALQHAAADDLILIAGKGHEDYQTIGIESHHFSDREQALKALELRS